MRLGIISDIHGNLVALETVLRELERDGVDRIVCLGDVGSLGPDAHGVIERLQDLDCAGVLGNTDDWLLNRPVASAGAPANSRIMYEINDWNLGHLSEDDLAYLRALPFTLDLNLGDGLKALCFHGSPHSYNDVIAAVTPDDVVRNMLDGYQAELYMGGHTHIQMIRRYEQVHIVNVGSVGLPGVGAGGAELPINRKVRWAEYGVLNVSDGRLSIDLRRTRLDMDAVLEAGRSSGMPHLDWWLQKWG